MEREVRDIFSQTTKGIVPQGKSRTEQSHENETNINKIVSRAKKSGYIPTAAGQPLYGDFSNATDYFEARNRIKAAEIAFMALPAAVRSRFKNNPGNLLSFMEDPANEDEAVKLGIINKRELESPETTLAPDPEDGK